MKCAAGGRIFSLRGRKSTSRGEECDAEPDASLSRGAVRRQPAASGSSPTADVLSQIIVEGLEDAKAEEIVSIDLSGRTTLADRMIIASGRSSVHVGAIADRVVKACRDAGYPSPKVEGMPLCDWVLLDAQNAIVHIFRPDVRRFYNLEKMWSADRPGEVRQELNGHI